MYKITSSQFQITSVSTQTTQIYCIYTDFFIRENPFNLCYLCSYNS